MGNLFLHNTVSALNKFLAYFAILCKRLVLNVSPPKSVTTTKKHMESLNAKFPDAPEHWLNRIAEAGDVTWLGVDLKRPEKSNSFSECIVTPTKKKTDDTPKTPIENDEKSFTKNDNTKTKIVESAKLTDLPRKPNKVPGQTQRKLFADLKNPVKVSEAKRMAPDFTKKVITNKKTVPTAPNVFVNRKKQKLFHLESPKREREGQLFHSALEQDRSNTCSQAVDSKRKDIYVEVAKDTSKQITEKHTQKSLTHKFTNKPDYGNEEYCSDEPWPSLKNKLFSIPKKRNIYSKEQRKKDNPANYNNKGYKRADLKKQHFLEIPGTDIEKEIRPKVNIDRWPTLPEDDDILFGDFIINNNIKDAKENIWNE